VAISEPKFSFSFSMSHALRVVIGNLPQCGPLW